MKMLRMLNRSIRDSIKSVFRNFSLSLASISCITITLIIVAISMLASFNVQNFTKEIEKDLTIVVFLDSDTSEDRITDLKKEIGNFPNVESYEFESKEDVKQKMQKESEVLNTVLDGWSEEDNPLKPTFKLKVKNVNKIGKTADKIKQIENVSVVKYGEGMVETMISSFATIQKVAYGAVIALVVVTVFLIVNTIKLTIFSRKREISSMRLVGASNFTIKTPFIIEGMILGIFGSIIPIVFTTYGYLAFYNHFNGYLYTHLIKLIRPEPFIYQMSLIILVIGIIVGMIGSSKAVRKYLKV